MYTRIPKLCSQVNNWWLWEKLTKKTSLNIGLILYQILLNRMGISSTVFSFDISTEVLSSSSHFVSSHKKEGGKYIYWWIILGEPQNYNTPLTSVGIQTTALLVTLWISYGHPVRIKRAGWSFEFHLSIILAVIWISRTVAGSKNWMSLKESLRVSSNSILIILVKINNWN